MEKEAKMSVKRIVLIGPESTGKTELSKKLAERFNTCYVPEYAREYIESLNRDYTYEDVEHIAKMQVQLESEFCQKEDEILFFDTYLIITKIWFKVVFNKVPDWLNSKIEESNIDLYLLCNTDLPWISDPVRENGGEMREKLFEIYKKEIEELGAEYYVISGTGEQRTQNAIEKVNEFLNIK